MQLVICFFIIKSKGFPCTHDYQSVVFDTYGHISSFTDIYFFPCIPIASIITSKILKQYSYRVSFVFFGPQYSKLKQ